MTRSESQFSQSLANEMTQGLKYLICIVVALIILVPIAATVMGGLKTSGELQSDPFGLPVTPRVENYTSVLTSSEFWRQVANSTIVMLATVGLSLTVSSMAAFILARLSFRGRDLIFNYIAVGLVFPFAVAILPLYVQLRQIGLLDTLAGVYLPQVAFSIPVNVLILRSFFRSIPGELEDAAYIDGCSTVGFFWRILLPLARPALATVAVLVMVASWNNFLLPLLVLNERTLWTLPMGIMQFQGQYGTDWAKILAFVTLAIIPAVVFYLLAQRQLIAGLTAGAVKG